MKFRYDISFLRAISVLFVLLFHYQFSFFKGGFVGVDVFFVISGFLMTKIILQGFDKNTFNIFEFYKKRIVRIFPALLTTIIFFAIAVYILIPTQIILYLRSAFSSSLFFSNIYYYLNNGYFEQSSKYNFLLHTWSLSVEWQFYLIFPILLLLLKNIYEKNLLKFKYVFFTIAIFSFISMLIHNQYDKSYSFFIFYTRAWEMMFGGLALLYINRLQKLNNRIKFVITIISLVVIAVFVFKADPKNWPSFFTLLPVIGTTLIIGINYEFAIYRNKIIKYLGDISYSLYLYHWPIYVISLFFSLSDRFRYRILFIVISVILSVLSYEFIEKRNYKNKTKYILFTSVIIFIISFTLSKIDANFYLPKTGELANVAANYKYSSIAKKQFNLETKHLGDLKHLKDFNTDYLAISTNGKKNIILLGDSHAGMFAETFENISLKNKYNLIQITADGTFPMINSKSEIKVPIEYFNFIFKNYLPKNYKKIDLVVISSNYAAYPQTELESKINFTQQYFKKYNIPVLYIGQTHIYPIDFPTYHYMKANYNVNYAQDVNLNEAVTNTNNYLLTKLGGKYIDIYNLKIDHLNGNYPYIYDKNHLTYYGSEQFKGIINSAISFYLK